MDKKKRAKPLAIIGSFDDLIRVSVSGNPTPKPKKKKASKKK